MMAIRTKTPLVICSTIRDLGAIGPQFPARHGLGAGYQDVTYIFPLVATFLSQAMKTMVVFFLKSDS